ncbi:MAG: hypothetical protein PHG05_01250 [Candidatus Nanoarchaeia archaeon]|nr:hypothetical protein [Candidatus Nanoarchaeia archaeon]
MNWWMILIGILVLWLLIELLKHLFLRKTAKVFITLLIILLLFLGTSKLMIDSDIIKKDDSEVITTGAAITDKILNTFGESKKININDQNLTKSFKD